MDFLMCSSMTPFCDAGCADRFVAVDDEEEPYQALRLFARIHLQLPEGLAFDESVTEVPATVRNLTEDQFHKVFAETLIRRGFPVLKYGKGTSVKRCLQIDNGQLSWGSRKSDDASASKSVPVESIIHVGLTKFDDAPEDVDSSCCLAFNINNTSVLKIITYNPLDAQVLIHGFNYLIDLGLKHKDRTSTNSTTR